MGLWFRDCGFLGCQSITHNVCYNTGLGFSRWHFLEKRCENVFLWVFTAVLEQHNWKQPEEGRICLSYMSWATVHWEKRRQEYKQGWNLEAAADIEAMRVVLLTGFLQMPWSACFLMAPRTTSLRVAPIMVSWPFLSANNQENAPQACSQASGVRLFFLTDVLLFKMMLACVRSAQN